MSEPKRPSRSVILTGVIVTSVVFLTLLVHVPKFVRGGSSRTNGIINNLRQLDGAKQQWALDHNRTGAVEVTREDIAGYVRGPTHRGWIQPVAGERYVLKHLTESREAELTRTVDGRPQGTRIRLLPNGTRFSLDPLNATNLIYEIILPNPELQPTAAQRLGW